VKAQSSKLKAQDKGQAAKLKSEAGVLRGLGAWKLKFLLSFEL
jgi:hypothetical protein